MTLARFTPAGGDGTYRYETAALAVFWPENEHRKLLERWPHLATEVGATWDEHRQRAERHCAIVIRAGHSVNQLAGDATGFEKYLQAKGITNPTADDLLAYPDLRTVTSAMAAWPPERIAPCWCGSERRYKRCCRPHGLGSLG